MLSWGVILYGAALSMVVGIALVFVVGRERRPAVLTTVVAGTLVAIFTSDLSACRFGRCLGAWTKTFTDRRLCAAIVDQRILGGNIIETGSDSCRLAHSRARKARPAR